MKRIYNDAADKNVRFNIIYIKYDEEIGDGGGWYAYEDPECTKMLDTEKGLAMFIKGAICRYTNSGEADAWLIPLSCNAIENEMVCVRDASTAIITINFEEKA